MLLYFCATLYMVFLKGLEMEALSVPADDVAGEALAACSASLPPSLNWPGLNRAMADTMAGFRSVLGMGRGRKYLYGLLHIPLLLFYRTFCTRDPTVLAMLLVHVPLIPLVLLVGARRRWEPFQIREAIVLCHRLAFTMYPIMRSLHFWWVVTCSQAHGAEACVTPTYLAATFVMAEHFWKIDRAVGTPQLLLWCVQPTRLHLPAAFAFWAALFFGEILAKVGCNRSGQ